MTEPALPSALFAVSARNPDARHLARRHRRERRFRALGLSMVLLALAILVTLTGLLAWNAVPGLLRTELMIAPGTLLPRAADGRRTFTREQLADAMQAQFPNAGDRAARRELLGLLSLVAPQEMAERAWSGEFSPAVLVPLTASDAVDRWRKMNPQTRRTERDRISLSDRQIGWLESLERSGNTPPLRFNWRFFTGGDSREPELAGFGGAIAGSLWLLLVCLGVSFPLAVATAIYLEEFKPQGRWIDFIEVNINNLAAVPSIVFGLLGLALFLNVLGMPRSAPLVGGLTLALMILPTIIIATRAALKSVPPSIRDAARGMGASDLQVVAHHTLPLALPGIMTGTILGLARAIGETAPLLMIGMVAFIVDPPRHPSDPGTVMPVQIYLWANNPEVSFLEKTSAGILVLLAILAVLNAAAIWLRRKFEVRW